MLADSEIESVLVKHNGLDYDRKANCIEGELWVSEDDSYFIRVDLSPCPDLFPSVFETGERIPWKMDRHIYPKMGNCCFTTTAKAQILLKTKINTLLDFIDEIVVPFFWNNSYFEIEGEYYDQEYSHGPLGVVEGYRDILRIENDLAIAKVMLDWVENNKLKVHSPCYCGSGIAMKKCNNGLHDRCYRLFRKIDKGVVKYDLHIHFTAYFKETGQL